MWVGVLLGAVCQWGAGQTARGSTSLICTPAHVCAQTRPSRLVAAVPPTPAMSQASALAPPLRSFLLLALSLGPARTLDANDPNTCSFWER